MSYDLFLKPRGAPLTAAAFSAYFRQRPHVTLHGNDAHYQNEDTGVYFSFAFRDAVAGDPDDASDAYPVAFNINYFRPSFFILEAAPEVAALVAHFDMAVQDPQVGGMGDGEFDVGLLEAGWAAGNAFACTSILQQPHADEAVMALPTAKLLKAWQWNLHRSALQTQLGEATFVPAILFFTDAGRPITAATWPDGIPIALPEVDCLLVVRDRLAPRQWHKGFRRQRDHCLVPLAVALPLLERHRRPDDTGFVLDYTTPPKDVKAFVASCHAVPLRLRGFSADHVLDAELMAPARTAPAAGPDDPGA